MAIFAPSNRNRVLAAYREELARALKDGFTEEEVADAKRAFNEARLIGRAADSSLAGELAEMLSLDQALNFLLDREQRLAALTVDQVNAALRGHVKLEDLVEIVVGDFPLQGK